MAGGKIIEKQRHELGVKVEINNLINHMLDCLLNKEGRKCNHCNCVDACSVLTEVVFVCRNKKIEKHEDCF